jgi:hypothetical protein
MSAVPLTKIEFVVSVPNSVEIVIFVAPSPGTSKSSSFVATTFCFSPVEVVISSCSFNVAT